MLLTRVEFCLGSDEDKSFVEHNLWKFLFYYLFFFSDLDECASESPACDINAACFNTVGSFSCACNPGYIGDGMICLGIQILDHGSMLQHRYSFEHETSARKKTCVTPFIKHCFRSSSAWYPGPRRCFYLLYEIKVEPRVWILFRFFEAQIYLSLEGKIAFGTRVLVDVFTEPCYLTAIIKLIKVWSLSSSLSFFLFNPLLFFILPHNHHLWYDGAENVFELKQLTVDWSLIVFVNISILAEREPFRV